MDTKMIASFVAGAAAAAVIVSSLRRASKRSEVRGEDSLGHIDAIVHDYVGPRTVRLPGLSDRRLRPRRKLTRFALQPAEETVHAFLKAQSDRDLDAMCALFAEDGIYINDPLPDHRQIRSRAKFREAFAGSPCIWCEDAELRVLRSATAGNRIHVERLDRFCVDGVWVEIPIHGIVEVEDGIVTYWKDYWCYAKYSKFVKENLPPGFSCFQVSKK